MPDGIQPLVATAFGSVIGYEALLRWNHPEHGPVSPEDFVPVAEEIGQTLKQRIKQDGPLNPDAVLVARPFSPAQDGTFTFPDPATPEL